MPERWMVWRGRFLEFWADAQNSLKPIIAPRDSTRTWSPTCACAQRSISHLVRARSMPRDAGRYLSEHPILARLSRGARTIHIDVVPDQSLERNVCVRLASGLEAAPGPPRDRFAFLTNHCFQETAGRRGQRPGPRTDLLGEGVVARRACSVGKGKVRSRCRAVESAGGASSIGSARVTCSLHPHVQAHLPMTILSFDRPRSGRKEALSIKLGTIPGHGVVTAE